jgi:hypothetical protein
MFEIELLTRSKKEQTLTLFCFCRENIKSHWVKSSGVIIRSRKPKVALHSTIFKTKLCGKKMNEEMAVVLFIRLQTCCYCLEDVRSEWLRTETATKTSTTKTESERLGRFPDGPNILAANSNFSLRRFRDVGLRHLKKETRNGFFKLIQQQFYFKFVCPAHRSI